MTIDVKKSQGVKVWMSTTLELELRRLADADERHFSEYCELILRRHVYGHVTRAADEIERANRGDAGRET